MKKFFTAAAIVLAACSLSGAHAAPRQTPSSVRVGPEVEERPATSAALPAPTPKKDEKKARPSDSASERKPVPRQEPTPAPSKQPTDIPDSTALNNVAPADGAAQPATSDAPPKNNNGPARPDASKGNGEHAPAAGDGKNAPDSNNAARPSNGAATTTTTSSAASSPAAAQPLTNVYRIGAGDVLDINLLNDRNPRQSTLYTVLAGGVLDYPLLKDPLTIAGMTTDELAAQLIADLRHRGVYERPQVRVSVREYASHAVLVSGLVGDPGTKILRREAVPLYVVVAEAQPKAEAGRAVVVSHATGRMTTVDLTDAAAMAMLVQQGDVINLTARPPEFFYIGGEISAPGQKDFHSGMTLTQAVLASGGVTRLAGARVRVSRQGEDGRLVPVEYNLQEIEAGAVPDPAIRAGDRIEVSRAKK